MVGNTIVVGEFIDMNSILIGLILEMSDSVHSRMRVPQGIIQITVRGSWRILERNCKQNK